jgi:hypothetical protein
MRRPGLIAAVVVVSPVVAFHATRAAASVDVSPGLPVTVQFDCTVGEFRVALRAARDSTGSPSPIEAELDPCGMSPSPKRLGTEPGERARGQVRGRPEALRRAVRWTS